MSEPAEKKTKMEDLNFISNLPDEILIIILSLLPIDEAVRSSIFSKRWESLWKHTTRLDLDAKHMTKPLTQLGISSSPATQLDYILNLPKQQGIYRHSILLYLILHRHLGDLKSCKFRHFPQRDVQTSIDFIFERKEGIEDLTLECRPKKEETTQRFLGIFAQGIFSSLSSLELVNYNLGSSNPFVGCEKLRTLKLKKVEMEDDTLSGILKKCALLESLSLEECLKHKRVMIFHGKLKFCELRALCVGQLVVCASSLDVLIFDSLACPAKGLVVHAPRLRDFRSQCNTKSSEGLVAAEGEFILRTDEILENLSDTSWLPRSDIFVDYLSSLIIDLDLNNKRAVQALSFVLTSCVNLRALEITTPLDGGSKFKSPDDGDDLPYPMLWERNDDVCHYCVHKKLKYVSIVGFAGKELETDFVKHLITQACNMEKITIVCKSSKKEAAFLVSLQHQIASVNLSIIVKIAAKNSPPIELSELLN